MNPSNQNESPSTGILQPTAPDSPSLMDRRKFVKSTAGGAAALLTGLPQLSTFGRESRPGNRPNILFIVVDQLRFPSVFPDGIRTAAEFLEAFAPNIYRLWANGVKFSSHYTAAVACTPSRGTIITGLYAQQSWLAGTITSGPDVTHTVLPTLRSEFPTYGKLLRAAGYQTPYFGKWHVSLLDPSQPGNGLERYGFTSYSWPDPTGANLQGTVGDPDDGFPSDEDTSRQATDWLAVRRPGEPPWCATVGFVNPHDKEYFWAGTEFETYNALFNSPATNPTGLAPFVEFNTPGKGPVVDPAANPLKTPGHYGYPELPPNWESSEQLFANKPHGQTFAREFSHAVWGGVTDQPGQNNFTLEQYPASLPTPLGIGNAPFHYWRRNLDSYTQTITIVDQRVGEILAALPAAVSRNTVIVFTADHGEFAGAHGIVAGKIGTAYEEAFHVPLIVVDPSGRFTRQENKIRTGLTSTVDLLRLLVTLGHGGSDSWLAGDLRLIYGLRHDLMAMLQSANAPGRDHVLFSYDERAPSYYQFLPDAPTHIVGMRTKGWKLGTYSNWAGGITLPNGTNIPGAVIDPASLQSEFYDYSTRRGQLELENLANNPARARQLDRLLGIFLNQIVPHEMRADLPPPYGGQQLIAKLDYLAYAYLLTQVQPSDQQDLGAPLFGFGRDF